MHRWPGRLYTDVTAQTLPANSWLLRVQPLKWPCGDSEDSACWSTASSSILVLWTNRNGFHMPAIKLGKRGKGERRRRGSGWAGEELRCLHTPSRLSAPMGLESWRALGKKPGSGLGGSSDPEGGNEWFGLMQETSTGSSQTICLFKWPPTSYTLKTHSRHVCPSTTQD